MSLRQIESTVDTITQQITMMDRTRLASARRELDQLELDVTALHDLNPQRARVLENRIQSARITLLARLASLVAKQRQADAEAHERELRLQAQIAGGEVSFAF